MSKYETDIVWEPTPYLRFITRHTMRGGKPGEVRLLQQKWEEWIDGEPSGCTEWRNVISVQDPTQMATGYLTDKQS
jgi:hypothetical protein